MKESCDFELIQLKKKKRGLYCIVVYWKSTLPLHIQSTDTFKLVSPAWMNSIEYALSNLTLSWIITSPTQNDAPHSGLAWRYTSNLSSVVNFNAY